MKKTSEKKKRIILYSVVIVFSLVFTLFASRPNTFKYITQELDEKKTTAIGIAATASAVSIALAAIPEDATTPIAQEVANIASYVLLATCVILAEKLLLKALSIIAFGFIIPIAFILKIYCLFKENDELKKLTTKIVTFAIALFLVIPVSVGMCNIIEHSQNVSMENSLEEMQQLQEEVEDEGFWSKIKSGASGLAETVKIKVSGFIDLVSVMIVTTCIIPILVLIFVLWMIKTFFGIDLQTSRKNKSIFKKRTEENTVADNSN